MLAQKKRSWNFLCFIIVFSYISQIILKLRLIGNRTSCRPIRFVIILAIKQIGLPLRGRPILLITGINYRPNWTPLSPFTITNHLLVVSITDSYKKKRISFKKDRKKNRWWKSVNTNCCLQWNAFQSVGFKILFLKVLSNP